MAQCGLIGICSSSHLLVYDIEFSSVITLEEEVIGWECLYQLFIVAESYADPYACSAELTPLLYATTKTVEYPG